MKVFRRVKLTSEPGVNDECNNSPATSSAGALTGRKTSSCWRLCPGSSCIAPWEDDPASSPGLSQSRLVSPALSRCVLRDDLLVPSALRPVATTSEAPTFPSLCRPLESRGLVFLRSGSTRFTTNGPRVSNRKKIGMVKGLLRLT